LDVKSFVLSLIVDSLGLDPEERKEIGIELAKKYLEEGKNLIDKDPLFRLVKSCIELLRNV